MRGLRVVVRYFRSDWRACVQPHARRARHDPQPSGGPAAGARRPAGQLSIRTHMLRDMMPNFELYQPDSLDTALDLAARLGDDGWLVGGGQDSWDWLKNRTRRTRAVVDLSAIAALKGVRETDGGIEIGALTTLTEVENDPLVRERYKLLSIAAGRVASPQIRNAGTLGGNLCQDTRCWYYRGGVDCYRAGG